MVRVIKKSPQTEELLQNTNKNTEEMVNHLRNEILKLKNEKTFTVNYLKTFIINIFII